MLNSSGGGRQYQDGYHHSDHGFHFNFLSQASFG